MTTSDVEKAIVDAPAQIPELLMGVTEELSSPDICLEDFKNNTRAYETLIRVSSFLKALKGRKVRDTGWLNIRDRNVNPDGTIGHFRVILEKP